MSGGRSFKKSENFEKFSKNIFSKIFFWESRQQEFLGLSPLQQDTRPHGSKKIYAYIGGGEGGSQGARSIPSSRHAQGSQRHTGVSLTRPPHETSSFSISQRVSLGTLFLP